MSDIFLRTTKNNDVSEPLFGAVDRTEADNEIRRQYHFIVLNMETRASKIRRHRETSHRLSCFPSLLPFSGVDLVNVRVTHNIHYNNILWQQSLVGLILYRFLSVILVRKRNERKSNMEVMSVDWSLGYILVGMIPVGFCLSAVCGVYLEKWEAEKAAEVERVHAGAYEHRWFPWRPEARAGEM